MMLSILLGSTVYTVFGGVSFLNIPVFVRGWPLARTLNETGYVPGAIFEE